MSLRAAGLVVPRRPRNAPESRQVSLRIYTIVYYSGLQSIPSRRGESRRGAKHENNTT
jgi:hypothetical protein